MNSEEVEAEVGGISRERSSRDEGRELVWMQKLLERRVRLQEGPKTTSWMANSFDFFVRSVFPKLRNSHQCFRSVMCVPGSPGDLVKRQILGQKV